MPHRVPLVRWPDGIGPQHSDPPTARTRHASLLSVLLLGAIVAVGLSGWAGGRMQTVSIDNDAVSVSVRTPTTIRVGQILQVRVHVAARRPVEELVLALQGSLLDQIAANAMIPGAASEAYENGMWVMHFQELSDGGEFVLQFSQQINPRLSGINSGRLQVRDGAQLLAELPLAMKVLP